MATQAERDKLAAALKPKKRSKYGAVRATVDGQKFDSTKESQRWCELVLLEKAGKITHLRRNPIFELRAEGGGVVGTYVGDFQYIEDGRVITEDVKGGEITKTKLYRWKKKHVMAQFGFEIREV